VKALFLVPRGAEAAALERAGARFVALPAGAHAAAALPADLRGERVIVTGLCGALGLLAPQTIVVYDAVVDEQRRYVCDAGPAELLPGAQHVLGTTAARVVTTTQAKRELGLRTGAQVVDMEGSALAAALAARDIGFAMIRVVSDDARYDLPPLANAIDAGGTLRPERVALAFARKPFAAVRFVRESLRALRTLEQLARTIIAAPD